jgi:hypothetical protein
MALRMKKPTSKKLSLSATTIRALDGASIGGALKSIPPLTFYPCDTANCLTLGPLCGTSGCILTFTICA